MPKLYKVAFFERDYRYVSHAPIEAPALSFDYLSLDGISIRSPSVKCRKGLFAHITDQSNAVAYQGVVDSTVEQNGVVTVSISPLLKLFDTSQEIDLNLLHTGAVEQVIANALMAEYGNNSDAFQNIPGLRCVTTSSTRTALDIRSDIHEMADILERSLTGYGVVAGAYLDVPGKSLTVTIGEVLGEKTISADLRNCSAPEFSIGDNYGALNKITYKNKDNPSERVTYYLHTDGSVDQQNHSRVLPPVQRTEFIESENFSEDAHRRALDTLKPAQFNNLIKLTFAESDELVRPLSYSVGQKTTIIHGKAAYSSILTGWEREGGQIKLVFGAVRRDITKILARQWRKQNAY